MKKTSHTHRKEVQKLDESEYLRLLKQASQIMFWVSNKQHDCIYVNRALLDFCGLSLEQALGLNWQKTIHPDDLGNAAPYFEFGPDYKAYRTECRMRRCDGQYRWIMVLGVPLLTPRGKFNGYLGLIVDIDDQKTMEKRLLNNQKRLENLILKIREITEESLKQPRTSKRISPRGIEKLSRREFQVLRLIGEGKSSRKIALELSVHMKTINTYLRRMKQKLGVESLPQLMRIAVIWVLNSDDHPLANPFIKTSCKPTF